MAGNEFEASVIDGLRVRNIRELQEVRYRPMVHRTAKPRQYRQSFELGSEAKPYPIDRRRVIQRLLAHAVTRQKQLLPARIPNRESEHAVQELRKPLPNLFILMHQHFRIAVGCEPVPFRNQRLPEIQVVVNLAVEYYLNRTVFIA